MLKKNCISCVCRYLIKKCLEYHNYVTCKIYSKSVAELNDTTIYSYFRAYENSTLDTFGNHTWQMKILLSIFGHYAESWHNQTKSFCLFEKVVGCGLAFYSFIGYIINWGLVSSHRMHNEYFITQIRTQPTQNLVYCRFLYNAVHL